MDSNKKSLPTLLGWIEDQKKQIEKALSYNPYIGLDAQLSEQDPNDCGGCETCDQVFGPRRVHDEITAFVKITHKCCCPIENFSMNGTGCVCGGE